MAVLTPSVDLIGKNANNRDVSIRFEIHEIPATDAEWIRAALERDLPVDEEKTQGNIVVGQHKGFAGLIKSYDSLERVLHVRNLLMPYLDDPEYRDALGYYLKSQEIAVEDFEVQRLVTSGPYKSFAAAAKAMGYFINSSHPGADFLNVNTDWKTVLLAIKAERADYWVSPDGIRYFRYEPLA